MRKAFDHIGIPTATPQPGESWEAVFENVRSHVLAVKAKLGVSDPFGVGLRLSAEAVRFLMVDPVQLVAGM